MLLASGSGYAVQILCRLWKCGCNHLLRRELLILCSVQKNLLVAPKSGIDKSFPNPYPCSRRRSKGLVQIMLASPK